MGTEVIFIITPSSSLVYCQAQFLHHEIPSKQTDHNNTAPTRLYQSLHNDRDMQYPYYPHPLLQNPCTGNDKNHTSYNCSVILLQDFV